MKLLSKYNRANMVATIIVMVLSAVFYYFFIDAVLVYQLDKSLQVEEKEIADFVKENKQLPEASNYKDEQEIYTENKTGVPRKFRSIKIYNAGDGEQILYRQLEFQVTIAGKTYKVEVRKSQEETEDLVQLIVMITLGMIFLLLATLFIINRFVFRKLWKPFQATLQQMKRFNLSGQDQMQPESTNIDEFNDLNSAVSILTQKASRDYQEIKSFTENASHEIQTPLAIIQSKLELLSQSESLNEEQMHIIQSVSETSGRLSKLNQSLILLTKIENRQFTNSAEVDMSRLIERYLHIYEELFLAKEFVLTKNIEEKVCIHMNDALAEILVINLLSNAIKHNLEKGSIHVELTHAILSVTNTGKPPYTDPEEFFERFKKNSASGDSLGLGLSIVKKICDAYAFPIKYTYENGFHTLVVNF